MKMADETYVPRNIHHDSDTTTTSSDESFVVEEQEDEFNTTTYFNDHIEGDSTDDESNDKELVKDNVMEISMEIDSDAATAMGKEPSKDCLIEMPMELDLDLLMETRKSHIITCPVCYEISVLTKDSKLYDNLIAACWNGNKKM